MSFYTKVFGEPGQKFLRRFDAVVDDINNLEKEFEALSDKQVRAKTDEFRKRLAEGTRLDDLLPEAFANVREAAKRTVGMRPFDVQLKGALVLHHGKIAEMRTGEGKTMTATLPVYLNALEGKGVHVVTVNDYLAKRDAVWMGQIYDFLGMSVGIIQNQRVTYIYDTSVKDGQEGDEEDAMRDEFGSFHVQEAFLRPATRKDAYHCDITYGTNNEFGFDYLRDNMVQGLEEMVMRPGNEMHYAIIDEIDSILIDESRTPLIISAPAGEAADQYYQFAKLVKLLVIEEDYTVDEKMKSAALTDAGIKKFEQWLGVDNVYVESGIQTVHHIEQALKAEALFHRDKQYIVNEEKEEVVIIDEFTGRKMPGRRYSEGLHQAIEAKEGVSIQRESRTLATITFQNLFRMYDKLSGMTGTAKTEEEEFYKIYGIEVIVLPTNRPDQRLDHTDRIYRNDKGKIHAIAEKIKECRAKGQPMLIGTISVEKNEQLSLYLQSLGIQHEILNAKNHEREAEIIAQAGRYGAVTLATNMAGRGVDIKLGGSQVDKAEEEKIKSVGGLFVLGTERHESRRIDNQLRGRSARQGDPGETQFFVSTEDDLMRIFAGERLKNVMTKLNVPEDVPIEQKMITKMLENAQKKVESSHFDSRKHLLEYDDVLNRHREVIYTKRKQILLLADKELTISVGETSLESQTREEEISKEIDTAVSLGNADKTFTSLKDMIMDMIESEIECVVSYHTNLEDRDKWGVDDIFETMKSIFSFSVEEKSEFYTLAKNDKEGKLEDVEIRDAFVKFLMNKTQLEYDKLQKSVSTAVQSDTEGERMMKELERGVMIRAIDMLWVDHLVSIDYLRSSIGLQGYAQRDPLVEYKRETYGLFSALLSNIQKEVAYAFFKLSIGVQMAPSVMTDDKLTLQGATKETSTQGEHIEHKERNKEGNKIGRNDPCPCGSGKKYKKCHGA